MLVSEITNKELADYLKLEYASLTVDEKSELDTLLAVAKSFIMSYTGLDAVAVDTHADFVIVVYVLVQDMYDNRSMYVDAKNMNKVVETILGMHCTNLL